jgi:hypothetical protein
MSRALPWALGAFALALVAGGLVLFVAGNRPAGVGGTTLGPDPGPPDAYRSELQLTFDEGPAVLWTQTSALGAAIALLGVLVVTGVAGWAAGLRSARNRSD